MSIIRNEVFENRIGKMRTEMRERDVDFIIVYSDVWRANNVAYFTDYRSGAGGVGQGWNIFFLPLDGEPMLFAGFEMTGDAAIQGRNLKHIYPSYDFEAKLGAYCADVNPGKIGIVGNEIITWKVYSIIRSILKKAEIVNFDPIIARERWIKTDEEAAAIKKSTLLNDKAMTTVIDAIKDGVTELELSAIGSSVITGHGADLSFIPTVSTGINSSIAMKRSTNRKVERGDIILLDFGAIYEGYASDTSRTIGYYLNDSYKRDIISAALAARDAAISNIKPGVPMRDIEAVIRDTITQRGFGRYLLHNSGHGVGVDSSEEDFPMSLESEEVIRQGMVFTVEPGIYIPGVGGCRIEEAVHVTHNGCDVFSELKPDYFID